MSSLCRRYGVTAAGFYAWRRRGESAHAERDRILSARIADLFAGHQQRYGSPRIHHALRQAGWVVSRRRVARLMRQAGLYAKAVRGYRAKATIHRRYARHPNRLWTATVTQPNQVWVGDITYLCVERQLALPRGGDGPVLAPGARVDADPAPDSARDLRGAHSSRQTTRR